MLAYRIISDIILVLVTIPLHILVSILNLMFYILNGFHWSNFYKRIQLFMSEGISPSLAVVYLIIGIPLEAYKQFIVEIKLLKTCKL